MSIIEEFILESFIKVWKRSCVSIRDLMLPLLQLGNKSSNDNVFTDNIGDSAY